MAHPTTPFEWRKAFGRKLRYERTRLCVSQEDLARDVGVKRAAVSFWETGKTTVTAFNMQAIANALGIGVDQLLPEEW